MKSPSNFERLVLGCMDSYDSNQILILQHFMIFRDLQDLQSFAPLRSQKFSRRRVTILAFLIIFQNYSFKNSHFIERAMFRQHFDEVLIFSFTYFYIKKRKKMSEFHEHGPNVKNFQFLEKRLKI